MNTAQIVLGLCFGDEGKGLTTSYLYSKNPGSIVTRFNGTCQAGHNVVVDNQSHIFSHFGSATLQDGITYWSEYCPVHPINFYNEHQAFINKIGIGIPKIYINENCPIITDIEILNNINDETNLLHGTVGVGFGKTIERELNGFNLTVNDLKYPSVFKAKYAELEKIKFGRFRWEDKNFFEKCEYFRNNIIIVDKPPVALNQNYIFEGAQGILLDQKKGFFPNVTRSNTTSENALELISRDPNFKTVEIYYVMRSYLTRHGNGYMPNEASPEKLGLVNIETETNVFNNFQQNFRYGYHDAELLNYALQTDVLVHTKYPKLNIKKNLVITCLDQTNNEIISKNLNIPYFFQKFDNIFKSRGRSFKTIYETEKH